MSGLALVGIPILTQMGLGAAGAVLAAVMIAVTLVPALFGFAGHKIDRLTIGRARTGSATDARDPLSASWARRATPRPTRTRSPRPRPPLVVSHQPERTDGKE